MARDELNPSAGLLAAFCHDLAQLRAAAGFSLRELEKRSGYSKAALSKAASGSSLPSFDLTMAYVGACGGDTGQWAQRWQQVQAWQRATDTDLPGTAAPPGEPTPPQHAASSGGPAPGTAAGQPLGEAVSPLNRTDPARIGPFRLLGRLGTGSMGQVFLGISKTGRPAAVKVVRADLADDPLFRRRFAAEVAAVRRVQGPYTPVVIDADPTAERPWMATAYIPGPSLDDLVGADGPLPASVVRSLAAGIAEALAAIHTAGILHRDLKPSNVLLDTDGPKVIDFGIARAADASQLTHTGAPVGTVPFMAPEQADGHPLSPAADIFSLGCLLAYAATGITPFGDGATGEVLYRIVHAAPDPAALACQDTTLRRLIEACLEKDPHRRPTPQQIIDTCTAPRSEGTWLPTAIAARIARRELELSAVMAKTARQRTIVRVKLSAIPMLLALATIMFVTLRPNDHQPLQVGPAPSTTAGRPSTPLPETSTPVSDAPSTAPPSPQRPSPSTSQAASSTHGTTLPTPSFSLPQGVFGGASGAGGSSGGGFTGGTFAGAGSPAAQAAATCNGATCNGKDPIAAGCNNDATTRYSLATSVGTLEARYSPACDASWARITNSSPGTWFYVQTCYDRYAQTYNVPAADNNAYTNMVPGGGPTIRVGDLKDHGPC